MICENQNFSRQSPPAEPGDVFVRCNLAQEQPHTPICPGVSGLRFEACNLVNCDLPDDASVTDSNTAQVRYGLDGDGCYCVLEVLA